MVNVDTVYQRVLALANKEQRGYITPLEFNLLANQAQMDIFEQYFYDLNQWTIQLRNNATVKSNEVVDMIKILEEKIALFEVFQWGPLSYDSINQGYAVPTASYRLGSVWIHDQTNGLPLYEIEPISRQEHLRYNSSQLAKATNTRPTYIRKSTATGADYVYVQPPVPDLDDPTTGHTIYVSYVGIPSTARWGYVVVNEKALYNSNTSNNFDLHGSEETALVYRILELAGITLNKPGLVQVAAQQTANKQNQEKQ